MSRTLQDIHSPYLLWVTTSSLDNKMERGHKWLEMAHELRKLGWYVNLISQGPTGYRSILGVETYCISQPNIFLVGKVIFHIKLLVAIAKWWSDIDIILFDQISAPWLLPIRFIRTLLGKDRPILVMDSRAVQLTAPTLKAQMHQIYQKFVAQLANKWADGQTAITYRLAKVAGIPEEKLWGTWPSGVKLEQFAPVQKTRRWPSSGAPIHLIYVGVLYHERNLMEFCQAVEAANDDGMQFVFTIIGDGSAKLELENYALQTQGRIRVLPPVPHAEIPALMGQAHVGVLPFRDTIYYQISSPIKLFEYLAAGLPILATRIACHTDVLGEADFVFWANTGSVEDLYSALQQAWLAHFSLDTLGTRAAAIAPSWTWEASAQKLDKALTQGMARGYPVSEGVKVS